MPKLPGKQVKDYIFGECLVEFEPGSEVAKAIKAGSMNLTVYDTATFPLYNNQIAQNSQKIYPAYLEIVRSQNFLYMIFQELIRPRLKPSYQTVHKITLQLQKLLFASPRKLCQQQIFMKNNGSGQLCIINPYTKNMPNQNNLYAKYHNKSILAQFFCEAFQIKDRNMMINSFVQNIQEKDPHLKLLGLLNINMPHQNVHFNKQEVAKVDNSHQKNTVYNYSKNIQSNEIPSHQVLDNRNITQMSKNHQNKNTSEGLNTKINGNKLKIKQIQQQYPEIDDKQYEQLMQYVHVNPSLKKEAGQAYMRQSVRDRKNQAQNQITQIVNNVNTSIFNVTKYKTKQGKSKVQIKLSSKKLEICEFQVHFQAHYAIFKLLKQTCRSYLQKYKKGFAGIIAAYLLTLIGILKRLRIYTDLVDGIDIYQIGGQVLNMNFDKYTNAIKRQLAKQARALANLKTIIQNANMPYKTYEALMPYLQQDLQSINMQQTQNFCFFYMTILMRMNQEKTFHQILAMQVMYILINPMYSIVYSQEDMPSKWDAKYYQLKKVLISTLVPKWQI